MRSDASFFTRLTRHWSPPDRDAREDRLTEVCAAVFAHPQGAPLARTFALAALDLGWAQTPSPEAIELRRLLSDDHYHWECDSRTQRTYAVEDRYRRTDLELRFTTRGAPELLVLFEVKHGIAPHDHQLADYLRVPTRRGPSAIVLIAPRGDMPGFKEAEIPPVVVRSTWQDVARALADFSTSNAITAFLREQLGAYLDEEGLMDPKVFDERHIGAMLDYREASEALLGLCDVAAQRVAVTTSQAVEPPGYFGQPRRQWWWSLSAPGQLHDDRWWDLKLLLDEGELLRGAPAVPCVTAGATFSAGALSALGIVDALTASGFEAITTDRAANKTLEYAVRIARLDAEDAPWCGRTTLQAQGEALGDWALQALGDLAAVLDDPPVADEDDEGQATS